MLEVRATAGAPRRRPTGVWVLTPTMSRVSVTLPNFRDVGGVVGHDGATVRTGLLLRSGVPEPTDTVPDGTPWPPALVAPGVRGEVPHAHYLVAELSGAVVGHAVVSVVVDVAELQRIAVSASSRRFGVASALLEECVALARSGRADRMLLEVREDNASALAFYAARGFTEVDRRPRYYRDGTAAVVMRLGLGPRCSFSG